MIVNTEIIALLRNRSNTEAKGAQRKPREPPQQQQNPQIFMETTIFRYRMKPTPVSAKKPGIAVVISQSEAQPCMISSSSDVCPVPSGRAGVLGEDPA